MLILRDEALPADASRQKQKFVTLPDFMLQLRPHLAHNVQGVCTQVVSAGFDTFMTDSNQCDLSSILRDDDEIICGSKQRPCRSVDVESCFCESPLQKSQVRLHVRTCSVLFLHLVNTSVRYTTAISKNLQVTNLLVNCYGFQGMYWFY